MLARDEREKLNTAFNIYETMISMVSVVLFSVTSAMIVPFVKLYTAGISDAEYIQPAFALLLGACMMAILFMGLTYKAERK